MTPNDASFWRAVARCVLDAWARDIGADTSRTLILTDHEIASARPWIAKSGHAEGRAEWTFRDTKSIFDLAEASCAPQECGQSSTSSDKIQVYAPNAFEYMKAALIEKDLEITRLKTHICTHVCATPDDETPEIEDLENTIDRLEQERDDALDAVNDKTIVPPRAQLAQSFMQAEIQRGGLMAAMQQPMEFYLKLADDMLAAEKKTRPQDFVYPPEFCFGGDTHFGVVHHDGKEVYRTLSPLDAVLDVGLPTGAVSQTFGPVLDGVSVLPFVYKPNHECKSVTDE